MGSLFCRQGPVDSGRAEKGRAETLPSQDSSYMIRIICSGISWGFLELWWGRQAEVSSDSGLPHLSLHLVGGWEDAGLRASFLGGNKREQRPSLISGMVPWRSSPKTGLPGRELVMEDLKVCLPWSASQSINHHDGATGG